MLESEKKLETLTVEQRLEKLEKQTKSLEIMGLVRATFIVLGVLGLTAGILSKLNVFEAKIKAKI
jgi:hypothetical protein